MKINRVPTNYAVTRRQKREIARRRMREAGIKHMNKIFHYIDDKGIPRVVPSIFSQRWRDFANQEVTE